MQGKLTHILDLAVYNLDGEKQRGIEAHEPRTLAPVRA
jgi:hypothetical protein